MTNVLTAAVITLIIFAFIGLLMTALIYKPFLTVGIIVLICMAIVFMLIHQSLKKDNDDCKDF